MSISIKYKKRLSSTNSFAKAQKELKEGNVIISHEQTQGRGQGFNQWESEPGNNITGSLVLHPTHIEPKDSFLISMAVSVGIIRFLRVYSNRVQIKWPNDIYFENKKLAGILIENEFTSHQITRSIVGVGININQHQFRKAPNPVSLAYIIGKKLDLKSLTYEAFSQIFTTYQELIGNADKVIIDYYKNLLGYNKWLSFRDDKETFNGKITNVAVDGKISIKNKNGQLHNYYFKEVEFLL